jgi:hypothetical protein
VTGVRLSSEALSRWIGTHTIREECLS